MHERAALTMPAIPGGGRERLGRAFVRLYWTDALLRSSVDFAAIGFAVYLFVAPLPLPPLSWLGPSSASSGPSTGAAARTTSGGALAAANLGQAADPQARRKANYSDVRIQRQWFKLSDPSIAPALGRAADLVEQASGAAALLALDEIGRPEDPNVLHISAYAHMLTREKDSPKRAYEAHLRAAKAGHPEAMDEVGQFLRLGAVGPADLPGAVEWYERGAKAGSASAATNAGRAYYLGWSRPIELEKAASYYRQGAEGGDPWGMNNYGACLISGKGVPVDARAGRAWIEKAAATGHATAQHNLAKLMRKGVGGPPDIDGFLRWAQAAGDQGFAPALHDLGLYYLEPENGRPADPSRAAVYLRQAAVKKHPQAQFAFATLSERGAGVPANNTQAFVFYSLALRNGESVARERLDALRARMPAQEIETAQKLIAVAN